MILCKLVIYSLVCFELIFGVIVFLADMFPLLTLCPTCLQMSSDHYVGFADGACHSTRNLSSATWALFAPDGELINLQGIFLGQTTNNVAEYSAVIELLSDAIDLGIRDLVVKLDSQLVVFQLNGRYSVHNPQILRMYLRVRLLERHFDFITYQHIP